MKQKNKLNIFNKETGTWGAKVKILHVRARPRFTRMLQRALGKIPESQKKGKML